VSPRAQSLLAELPFTAAERQKILDGALITTASRETSSDRELAITMAFLIADPPPDLAARFHAASDYKNDRTVAAYGEFHGDGSLADLAALHLRPGGDEARHFVDVTPGLDLNLSSAETAAFAALEEGDTAAVEAELRKQFLARYQAYRAKGLAGIAPYVRADGKESKPGEDLTNATKASRVFAKEAPDVYAALLDYPTSQPANATQSFFWVNFTIDGRPTIALTHRLVVRQADGTFVFVDRHYYVSRSHNDVQMVAGVFPVQEGALVLYSNRTTTDQLGGFGASAKQAIGRKVMGGQLSALFEELRTRVGK
jgi:hypothetical protein